MTAVPASPIKAVAPITAVVVYADRARVTRRARVSLTAGEHEVVFDDLPLSLQADSVRVAGTGTASVLGVDVARRHLPSTIDPVVSELEERLRQARAGVAALDDDDAVAAQRLEFLGTLAERAARAYAAALPAGDSDPSRIVALGDALDDQQTSVRERRRDIARRRAVAWDEAAAIERELEGRRHHHAPDVLTASVTLGATEAGDVDLEISYVVFGAGWHSTYDLRLDGDDLTLTWYGLVVQHTGEDWPECDLSLSTARVSAAVQVPELKPWFLDRLQLPVAKQSAPQSRARGGAFSAADEIMPAGAPMYALAAEPLLEAEAVMEQGVTAATYRPERAVAVPADGAAHRATVAVVHLEASRDYLTAPVLALEAHLRATVTNSSQHTLPSGSASVFHGGDFVGTTQLDVWAPGEEVELALGIDDRIRVERKLVRRTATKAGLGASRRRESEHRITITNHTGTQATVSVLDQLPVSRDASITVREQRLDPAPTERTELGVLTWTLELAPSESREIHLGVRVEVGRGVELAGWRE